MSTLAVHHLQREYREIEQSLARLDSLLAEQELLTRWTAHDAEDFQFLLDELGKLMERHIRKEEQILFPALERFLPLDAGPLSVLRGEHGEMRQHFRLLRRSVLLRAGASERTQAKSGIQHYGNLLMQVFRDHAYKETRVLFPMIARYFSSKQDNGLLKQMEEIDQAPVGSPGAENSPPRLVTGGRRTPMTIDKQDLIERLKMEVQVIEMGGYSPSVREPRSELHIFRDSVSCPNLGLQEKVEPCAHCFLMDFVPAEHSEKDDACHYIPLNEKGDTVKSLEAAGNPQRTQATVLAWLKAKIAELEG